MVSEADEILQFIRDELVEASTDRIDFATPLFRTHVLDSLNLLSLITFLEERFEIKVHATEIVFENFDTVNHLVAFLEDKRAARAQP
jgi:acyl carrier protein